MWTFEQASDQSATLTDFYNFDYSLLLRSHVIKVIQKWLKFKQRATVKLTSFCQSSEWRMFDQRPSGLVTYTNLHQVNTAANPTCRKWYISNLIACWYWLVLICMTQVLLQCPIWDSSSAFGFHFVIARPILKIEIKNGSKCCVYAGAIGLFTQTSNHLGLLLSSLKMAQKSASHLNNVILDWLLKGWLV